MHIHPVMQPLKCKPQCWGCCTFHLHCLKLPRCLQGDALLAALCSADSSRHKRALCQLSVWLDEGRGASVGSALAGFAQPLHDLLSSSDYGVQRHADTVVARLMEASPALRRGIMPLVRECLAATAVRAMVQLPPKLWLKSSEFVRSQALSDRNAGTSASAISVTVQAYPRHCEFAVCMQAELQSSASDDESLASTCGFNVSLEDAEVTSLHKWHGMIDSGT